MLLIYTMQSDRIRIVTAELDARGKRRKMMPEAKDFLSPYSMLTPGLAGAITTGIAMPLVYSFDLSFKWVALVIGFMLATLIVLQFKEGISRLQRAIYCVLNTLIIFSVSVGAGVNLDPPPQHTPLPIDPSIREFIGRSQASDSISDFIGFLGVLSAHAQPPEEEGHTENDIRERPTEEREQPKLTEEQIRRLQEYMQQQEQQKEKQQKYYQRWSW